MIVVRVDLLSARGREHDSKLAAVVIENISGGGARRSYRVTSRRKGNFKSIVRQGVVKDHPAKAEPVLTLLRKALEEMGY